MPVLLNGRMTKSTSVCRQVCHAVFLAFVGRLQVEYCPVGYFYTAGDFYTYIRETYARTGMIKTYHALF